MLGCIIWDMMVISLTNSDLSLEDELFFAVLTATWMGATPCLSTALYTWPNWPVGREQKERKGGTEGEGGREREWEGERRKGGREREEEREWESERERGERERGGREQRTDERENETIKSNYSKHTNVDIQSYKIIIIHQYTVVFKLILKFSRLDIDNRGILMRDDSLLAVQSAMDKYRTSQHLQYYTDSK